VTKKNLKEAIWLLQTRHFSASSVGRASPSPPASRRPLLIGVSPMSRSGARFVEVPDQMSGPRGTGSGMSLSVSAASRTLSKKSDRRYRRFAACLKTREHKRTDIAQKVEPRAHFSDSTFLQKILKHFGIFCGNSSLGK